MGIFFATIGASCSVAGVSPGTLAPLLGFITTMTVIHWGVLLAGARALCLEPSAVLVGGGMGVGSMVAEGFLGVGAGWVGLGLGFEGSSRLGLFPCSGGRLVWAE